MGVVVRAAVPADALGIARVHVAGWQVGYGGLLPAGFLGALSVEESAQRRARSLAEPPDGLIATLVAVREADVAGFANVGQSRDDDAGPGTGELWAIYVDPRHWGLGIGHVLHHAALEALRDAGSIAATLWVLRDNARAARFYERHGWAPDGASKTDWRDGVRLDEVRYRTDLEPAR